MRRLNLTDGELLERGAGDPSDGGAIGSGLGLDDDEGPNAFLKACVRRRVPFGEAYVVPVMVGSKP